jgi:hypothetical protein
LITSDHSSPIDVLLTDVVMPHMPGKELAGKLQAHNLGIRVLFMSGRTQGILSTQGVLGPSIHLLEKPFDKGHPPGLAQ